MWFVGEKKQQISYHSQNEYALTLELEFNFLFLLQTTDNRPQTSYDEMQLDDLNRLTYRYNAEKQ